MCNNHYARAHKYGLSAMQLDMLARTGACGCCGQPIDCDTMQIDHDHACCPGEIGCGACVRGVLCVGCNVGLGAFGDSPERLERAVLYLARNRV
ncbi:endonuclease domain-containing protein [Microbacterium sp. zg-YB36]|uniref:endonuclease domain-containing protein n=1 Tax=Microbacterium sp. zg-YB36 TaxID=2969407 RepID=UPI003364E713